MHFFSKLMDTLQGIPVFDKTEGHPHARNALGMLHGQDWDGLGRLYRRLAPADRTHLVGLLGEMVPLDSTLPVALGDNGARTMVGGMLHVMVQRLRGQATADRCSTEQARGVWDKIALARDLLREALRQAPHDSTVRTFLLRSMLHGGPDPEYPFQQAAEDYRLHGEQNIYTHLTLLQHASPRWRGSVKEMYDLADRYAGEAPNAAFLALKARAHIEDWIYSVHVSDNPRDVTDYHARRDAPGFSQSMQALDDSFWKRLKTSRLSFSEAHFAHNNLAALFALLHMDARVKPHLQALGAALSFNPWCFLDSQVNPYVHRLRRRLGLDPLWS